MTRQGRESVPAEDASRSEAERAEKSDRSQEVAEGGGTPAGLMLRYWVLHSCSYRNIVEEIKVAERTGGGWSPFT